MTAARAELGQMTRADFNSGLEHDPLAMMCRVRDEVGTTAQVDLDGSQRLFVTCAAGLISEALGSGVRTHRELLRGFLGSGLFIVQSGEQWRERRGLMRPLSARRTTTDAAETLTAVGRDFADRAAGSGPFDLVETMQRVSIRMILGVLDRTISGQQEAELVDSVHEALRFLDRRLFRAGEIGPDDEPRFWKRREELDAFIAERLTDGPDGFITNLKERWDTTDRELSATDAIIEEVLSVIIAGVETMGALFAWIFLYLSADPEALDRCRAEPVDAKRPYLRAVINEVLRLRPPAWALLRQMTVPYSDAHVSVFTGDLVFASTYATHHHPQLWPDPERFNPRRFLDVATAPATFFPFGLGPHRCPGQFLAVLEAETMISAVLAVGHIEVVSDGEIGLRPGIALEPYPSPQARLRPW